MHRCLSLASVLVLSMVAHAQVVRAESLTTWTHAGGPPNWNNMMPNAGSRYGVVDRLLSDTIVLYNSPPITLQPGTYVASFRLMKFQDAVGAAPILSQVIVPGVGLRSTIMAVTDQVVDQWKQTPELIFSVQVPNTVVIFNLQNTDPTITKQNYDFDSVVIGKVDLGASLVYESMGWRWGHAWGSPYYTAGVAATDTAFGEVEQLNNVWWFEWGWPTRDFTLQPGLYTANVRVKKIISLASAQPLDLSVDIGGNVQSVTLAIADQPQDVYTYTPDLVFNVTQPNTLVKFRFHNVLSTYKQNYHIDAFAIRRGSFTTRGVTCPSSLGAVTLRGQPPQLGEIQEVEARNVPSLGVMVYGTQVLNIDLTAAGMPGCFLYTNFVLLLPISATGGIATSSLLIPNDASLAGGTLQCQAVCADPGQNALGFVTSVGGQGTISF